VKIFDLLELGGVENVPSQASRSVQRKKDKGAPLPIVNLLR
jgi:hypothetical protein